MREKILSCVLLAIMLSSVMLTATTSAGVETQIRVEPALISNPDLHIAVGETFTVDIMISRVENLYAWGFMLGYSPARLVLDIAVDEYGKPLISGQTDFLGTGGSVHVPPPKVDIGAGTVYVSASLTGAKPGVSGDGKLATITFKVMEAGECALDLYDTKLLVVAPNLTPPPPTILVPADHLVKDGYYSGPTAELVRKVLPLGRDLRLSERNYQTFLSSVKSKADVPLSVKVKFHMVRDDGKIIDLWNNVKRLYVDGFVDASSVPIVGELLVTTDWNKRIFITTLKPVVSGSEKIYVDNVLQTKPAQYSIAYSTGTVTFVGAPGGITANYRADITGELLGTGDGTKTDFYTMLKPVVSGSEKIYLDGVLQTKPAQYSITLSSGLVRFVTIPDPGKTVTANYKADVVGELIGEGDGTKTTFTTRGKPVLSSPSEKIYVDNVLQTKPAQYTIDYPTGTVTFVTAPPKLPPRIITADYTADPTKWNTVGSNWLNAVNDDNYIYDVGQPGVRRWGNCAGFFSFEDITVPADRTIEDVTLDFYSMGFDRLYYWVWDGAKWATTGSEYVACGGGTDYDWATTSVGPVLDTPAKINSAKTYIRYRSYTATDAPPPPGLNMYVDAARLTVTLSPQIVQPGKVLEIDPVTWSGLTTADIGTYTCEAICYYSYTNIRFNKGLKTSTFKWWIAP